MVLEGLKAKSNKARAIALILVPRPCLVKHPFYIFYVYLVTSQVNCQSKGKSKKQKLDFSED